MKTFRFTKAAIGQLLPAPEGKREEYADSVVNGLRLRVTAAGAKSFCVTRKRDGKFFRVTLGKFPDLTVDQARDLASHAIGEVASTRKNPNEGRRESARAVVTLSEAFDQYIKSRGDRLKATTAKQYKSILQNFSKDWFGKPLASIDRTRVETRHKAITEGSVWFGDTPSRSRVASGSKAQADLWARALRAVYRYSHDHYRDAEGKCLLPDPPTMVLSSKRKWHGTHRRTSRIRNNELARWLSSVDVVRQYSLSIKDVFAVAVCDALDVALFTGLRRSEVFGLEWSRVNLSGRYFWIDETKNGDPLELPITNTLYQIFDRRKKQRKGKERYVFAGAKGGMIQEPRRIINLITAETGKDGTEHPIEFTCHDARRTFGSIAELTGVGSYILKRLMNHRTLRSADVTQGYLHFSADELQDPAKKIEQTILEHAGLVEKAGGLDAQLTAAFGSMSDDMKRELLFSILNPNEEAKGARRK